MADAARAGRLDTVWAGQPTRLSGWRVPQWGEWADPDTNAMLAADHTQSEFRLTYGRMWTVDSKEAEPPQRLPTPLGATAQLTPPITARADLPRRGPTRLGRHPHG